MKSLNKIQVAELRFYFEERDRMNKIEREPTDIITDDQLSSMISFYELLKEWGKGNIIDAIEVHSETIEKMKNDIISSGGNKSNMYH